MYIVNTTFAVDPSVQDQWLEIIKKEYIPFLEQNGFRQITFTRLISDEVPDHFTYSLQLDSPDLQSSQRLQGEIFPHYVEIIGTLFGDRVLWFSSLMKKIDF